MSTATNAAAILPPEQIDVLFPEHVVRAGCDNAYDRQEHPEDDQENMSAALLVLAGAYPALVDHLATLGIRVHQLDHAGSAFDLADWIDEKHSWSLATFGPGARFAGVLAHIRKELAEIEAAPGDLREWIDVILLALDGAARAGYNGAAIVAALQAKQRQNTERQWPAPTPENHDQAIEHIKPQDGVAE